MLWQFESILLLSGKEDDKTLRLQTLGVLSNGLLVLRFDPGRLTEVSVDMSSDHSVTLDRFRKLHLISGVS